MNSFNPCPEWFIVAFQVLVLIALTMLLFYLLRDIRDALRRRRARRRTYQRRRAL